jgi:hypothetical protein
MVRHESRRLARVFQHTSEGQLRPAQTEIDRGFVGINNKFRQVVSRSQPRQDPIPIPPPTVSLFPGLNLLKDAIHVLEQIAQFPDAGGSRTTQAPAKRGVAFVA